jgi:hypothetical protein
MDRERWSSDQVIVLGIDHVIKPGMMARDLKLINDKSTEIRVLVSLCATHCSAMESCISVGRDIYNLCTPARVAKQSQELPQL